MQSYSLTKLAGTLPLILPVPPGFNDTAPMWHRGFNNVTGEHIRLRKILRVFQTAVLEPENVEVLFFTPLGEFVARRP